MYSNHIANRPQKRKKEENKIKEDLDEFRFWNSKFKLSVNVWLFPDIDAETRGQIKLVV